MAAGGFAKHPAAGDIHRLLRGQHSATNVSSFMLLANVGS